MTKSKKQKHEERPDPPAARYNMSEKKIRKVRQWLERMQIHLQKAIALAEKLDGDQLSEADDLFWALAKYAENVEECAVQLDNINGSIFPCLIEFPTKSGDDELNWAGLKGMRNRLAHKFWEIDPDTLWVTVTRDFPKLSHLLSLLRISRKVGNFESGLGFLRVLEEVNPLERAEREKLPQLGNSIPCLYFDEHGSARCVRLGRTPRNEVLM